MNFRMIKRILAWILFFEAIFLTVPLITAIVYREIKPLLAVLITMAICCSVGGLLMIGKPRSKTVYSKEGFIIVSLSWVVLSFFGALPFYISGCIPSLIDAFFETVSGFTTTGASILNDVEALPNSMLIWRSFTHWVGGMGVLVFIMAFLPLSGANNMHIMKAESPGPSVSKLVPKIKTTAMILYSIYFVLTIAQFIILICAGMPVFEAMNTAFATAGTGGFSVKNDGLASYSPFIQVTVTVFMLLFSINFASYYLLLKGKLKEAFNYEIRVFLIIVFSAIAFITINISGSFGSIWQALNEGSFAVATVISTTGFSISDFDKWPEISRAILVLLMFVGACAGSTGGGIKVSRFVIFVKGVRRELHNILHPKQIINIKVDKKPIDNEVVRSINAYFACYIVIFSASVLLISLDNFGFTSNFTAVAATFNNIGPGLDMVGPTGNYSAFSNLSKLVLSFDMLAGRLEIFPMLLLFSPATWRKS